jgi:twitching motility protein PilU
MEQYDIQLKRLLAVLVEKQASDLFLTVGFPPALKINGKLCVLGEYKLSREDVEGLSGEMERGLSLSGTHVEGQELNFAHESEGLGRFRVNKMKQKDLPALVMRRIPTEIPKLSELKLPPVLSSLASAPRGLVLIVGATGSGKSTTLASLIDERNRTSAGHIITVEDPIEFVHRHQKSIVHQREVGLDTASWDAAIRNALRQAPDVVVIGEIRDQDTLKSALGFSETGHLCLATMHASNANQAIDRMLNLFPKERQHQILLDLSLNLKAIVSQRLLPDKMGGRHPAIEVLLKTPFTASLIQKGEISELKEAMDRGSDDGMKTFDQAVYELYGQGIIEEAVALRYADSENDVRLKIQLKHNSQSAQKTEWNGKELRIQESDRRR